MTFIKTTRVRIIDDIAETSNEIDVPGDRGQILTDLMFVRRVVHREYDYIRLTLHVRQDLLTIHWWADDMDFARSLKKAANVPLSVIDLLNKGSLHNDFE